MASPIIPDQVQDALSSGRGEPNVTDEKKFELWKSSATATAKLFLRAVKESADAFPPLKSVVGGLCFILDNYEVQYSLSMHNHCVHKCPQQTRANKQAIESLVPRIKGLSASLCKVVPEGNGREEMRRKELEQ